MDDYEPDDLLPEESGIIKCLDHGHVQFLDSMGSDHTICQDARQSYGKGTKTKNDDRGLIRRLMRDRHTSPFEMGEVKLHIKPPMFVARQWIRHRTASLNEYSGRYSIMADEFYVPGLHDMKPQSKSNKQGRDGELDLEVRRAMRETLRQNGEMQFQIYDELVNGWPWFNEDGDRWLDGEGNPSNAAICGDDEDIDILRHEKGHGLSRELARINLPLSTYTMFTWKIDLHNLFHFLRLRMDPHAQWEIRVFAQAVHDLVAPRFPLCFEAFYDYQLHAVTFSRHERRALATLLNELLSPDEDSRFEGLVKSEKREFAAKIAALRELA
jgi:thymidylate synthase (FAD)